MLLPSSHQLETHPIPKTVSALGPPSKLPVSHRQLSRLVGSLVCECVCECESSSVCERNSV